TPSAMAWARAASSRPAPVARSTTWSTPWTARLVGKRLTVFQVWAVSLVYSAFCLVALGGFYALSTRLWNLVYFRDGEVPVTLFFSVVVCAVGWLFSLAFMVNARLKNDTSSGDSLGSDGR
ncbi:MAG: hypothetical protein AAF525_05820, partial [Pseudomonadota bacterium]